MEKKLDLKRINLVFIFEPDDTNMNWGIKPKFYLEMVVSCDHHENSLKDSESLRYVIICIVVVILIWG